MEKIMLLGEIFFSSSRFFFVFFGEIINGVVKLESSELVSIINPFNSITAIMLVELSSPSSVMKSLSLSENKLIDKEIIITHPGPINRGVELSSDVIDSGKTVILDQVENGVAIRMAVMYLLASRI